jgi:CIC family chloride channel protein
VKHGLLAEVRKLVRWSLPNESQHLFALTLVLGGVCGLVAVAFHLAIRASEALMIQRALHASGSSWMAWTVFTPTLGGLLAGALLTWVVPGARGSGIPQVKQSFAAEGGRVRFRDAVGKFFISALQIGSGASLGREGPTAQICAGVASLIGRVTALPPRNMRRLTPVGVAAGIAAAFNAPIAAVTFTIEEIVGTLDQAVLSGVVVAAALAAIIERGILGVHPVIEVKQAYGLEHASSLMFYGLLGIAAAFVSIVFTDGLLKLRAGFRQLRSVPAWTHPAIGGLVTGVLAVVMLRFFATGGINGGGYDTLGRALAGELGLRVLLVLCVAKLVATVFSYSSGGAGGIFAPSLFVGAMLGGAVGHLDVLLLGHESRQLGAFALVGMGAVFAGVVRAPITSVLIIFEMTGAYGLVLPLMLANMTSYVIARRLRPTPIYEALLAQDGIVLPHDKPVAHPLEQLLVSNAMTSDVISVQPSQTSSEAIALVSSTNFNTLPVVDASGAVLGTVSVSQLRAATDDDIASLVEEAPTIRCDTPLLRAIVSMNDLGVRQLLVVDAESETRLVGILTISDVLRAHARTAPASDAGTP